MKVAVVTGGSGGIGRAAALQLRKKDYEVYEISRSGVDDYDHDISHITADLSDDIQIKYAFEQVITHAGRIDLLVNNAGYGISGAVELTEYADAKSLFDVNFFGQFQCIKNALPYLRKTGGRIINISSAAAIFPVPYQAFYSASKAAVNSLTMALANELKKSGVSVCALMPGDVKTGFTTARRRSDDGGKLYGDKIKKAVDAMEKDERSGMTPEFVASKIVKNAEKRSVRPLYVVGGKYKFFAFLSRLLTTKKINRTVGKMYR